MDAVGFRERRGPRCAVRVQVRYRKGPAHSVYEHTAWTHDVGLGGASIVTDELPEPGSPVSLTLTSPTAWEPLHIEGRVRWIEAGTSEKPRGFGVRFDELDERTAAALRELVESLRYDDPPTADGEIRRHGKRSGA